MSLRSTSIGQHASSATCRQWLRATRSGSNAGRGTSWSAARSAGPVSGASSGA